MAVAGWEDTTRIGVVGAGPRGVTVLERICANAAAEDDSRRVTVVMVDTTCVGTGTVWRRNQSSHLLMNTVASQVTVFTDPTVTMDGPVVPGPSLFEWATYLTKIRSEEQLSDQVRAEARDLTPNSYPTRTLYGHYLRWAFDHIVARYTGVVSVEEVTATVVNVREDAQGGQILVLDDGSLVEDLDSVVLTQGHLGVVEGETSDAGALTSFAGRHGLVHIAPANAADVDLDGLPAGEPVLVRGLGLTFFDYLTLLTIGRGGTFDRVGSRLVYRASGREPIVYAGSRRGAPYHARGENQKGIDGRHVPLLLTAAKIDELRSFAQESKALDFRADVWPLVAREVETVYYSGLLADTATRRDIRRFRQEFPNCRPEDVDDVLSSFGIERHRRWNWEAVLDPTRNVKFCGPAHFQHWLTRYLDADARAARDGNIDGAVKAALDVLRDLRNEVRLIVDHSGIRGSSYRDDLDRWFTPSNAFLSIGPPAEKIEQLAALMRAGHVRVIGSRTTVLTDEEGGLFEAYSPTVTGSKVTARVLIDARLPEPDIRRTADPLLRTMVEDGKARPYVVSDPGGGHYETGGLDVDRWTHCVVEADGRRHPRRFALGVPTEAVRWVTAAGPRPGVDSVLLADADAVARSTLDVAARVAATPQ